MTAGARGRLIRGGAARLGQAVLTVWLAATASFFALAAVPGDPVEARLGPLASVTAEQKQAIREYLGLDLPVWQQYAAAIGRLLRGDLGYSYQHNRPVTEVIAQQLGATAQLTAAALLIACALVALGQLIRRAGRSWRRGRVRAAVVETAELLAVAVPSYWVGWALLIVFAFWLGWFPAVATGQPASLVLPALALAVPLAGVLGRVLNAELDRAETLSFALSSRARGVGRGAFARTHGLRHAAPPVAGLMTTLIGGALGGAVLIEHVFARPGLGQVALQAIVSRDMPVIVGLVVLSGVVFAALGVVADLLVWWADPRGRAAGSVA